MKRSSILKLWGMPLALAILSIFGLVIALVGSSIYWDIGSWISLSVPLILIIYYYYFNRH